MAFFPIGGSFRGRDDDLSVSVGETELDQLRRLNNQKAAALEKAHQRIKELEEHVNTLREGMVKLRMTLEGKVGKRGEEIMADLIRRNTC